MGGEFIEAEAGWLVYIDRDGFICGAIWRGGGDGVDRGGRRGDTDVTDPIAREWQDIADALVDRKRGDLGVNFPCESCVAAYRDAYRSAGEGV